MRPCSKHAPRALPALASALVSVAILASCASGSGGSAHGGNGGGASGSSPSGAGPTDSGGGAGAPGGGSGGALSGPPDGGARTDASAPKSWTAKRIAAPPNYMGSVDNGAACSRSYTTAGFEPEDVPGARHPLFLYFVGTAIVLPDPSAAPDAQAPLAVTEAMARRGFVALSAAYDNTLVALISDHQAQLACLFGEGPATLLAAACGHPGVDCDLGIAVWGHSQGAFVAAMMSNHDIRVRAGWFTGYGGDARSTLAKDRVRVMNGEADTTNGTAATMNPIAGFSAGQCPDTASECFRKDGSGWLIVRKSDLAVPVSSSADHCWFDKRSCLDPAETLEPAWVDPASTKAFALEANADWVARTVARP